MKKLIMLKGLPASGKSQYAEQLKKSDPENIVVVTKDDIRKELGRPWSKELEKEVLTIRDNLISRGLSEDKLVISADTNLDPYHEFTLRKIAKNHNSNFEIKYFDTPLEVCIERDMVRENKVGSNVIIKMYNKYLSKPNRRGSQLEFKSNPDNLPKAIICDLDGTLAMSNGRSFYDESHEHLMMDTINPILKNLLLMYNSNGYEIIFCTGRKNKESTALWIKENLKELSHSRLLARHKDDNRKDFVVKKDMYEGAIAGEFFVEAVFDDRLSVCDMWVSLGLYVFCVNQYREVF